MKKLFLHVLKNVHKKTFFAYVKKLCCTKFFSRGPVAQPGLERSIPARENETDNQAECLHKKLEAEIERFPGSKKAFLS